MDAIPAHFPCRRLFELDWESLSDLELVALLIGPGTPEKRALNDARRLLDAVGPSRRLQEAGYDELCRTGLSRKKALALLAAGQRARSGKKSRVVSGKGVRLRRERFRKGQKRVKGGKKEGGGRGRRERKNRRGRGRRRNKWVFNKRARREREERKRRRRKDRE